MARSSDGWNARAVRAHPGTWTMKRNPLMVAFWFMLGVDVVLAVFVIILI